MVLEDSPTIQGSNNYAITFLWSRDKFIERQFSTIFGEDCQLVQTEVLCYRFKHQQYVGLPTGTIR